MTREYFKRRTEAEQYLRSKGYEPHDSQPVFISPNGLIDAVVVFTTDEYGAQAYHVEYRA